MKKLLKITYLALAMTGYSQTGFALTYDEAEDGPLESHWISRESLSFPPLDYGTNSWTGQLTCGYALEDPNCFDNITFRMEEGQYIGGIRLSTSGFYVDESHNFNSFSLALRDYATGDHPITKDRIGFDLIHDYVNPRGEPIGSLELEDETIFAHAGRRLREGDYGLGFTSAGFTRNDPQSDTIDHYGFDYHMEIDILDYEAVPEIDGATAPAALGFLALLAAYRRERLNRKQR